MYQMKKGGSKSAKQQAAIAMSMKAAGKKPKKMQAGGMTPFQGYVKKYPGSGSDTLTTPAIRNINRDDYNWMKTSPKQKADLNKAFGKTYSNYDSKAGSFRDSDGDLGGSGVRKPGMKKGGSIGKSKMKMGGSLKPVDKSKNPGLAKLPTPVRNKMGYQKYGGSTKMKKGGMVGKSKKK